jgi:hypothetical protein
VAVVVALESWGLEILVPLGHGERHQEDSAAAEDRLVLMVAADLEHRVLLVVNTEGVVAPAVHNMMLGLKYIITTSVATAQSALSALSGVLTVAIRRTPQTFNREQYGTHDFR